MKTTLAPFALCTILGSVTGCAAGQHVAANALGDDHAPIDRFSAKAGALQRRTAENHLPGPDQPVDFDHPPFITQSRGPAGEVIRYYNFDVRPAEPAVMYLFVSADSGAGVAGQDPVVDVIPGDPGYNDFFRVVRVAVPSTFVPNSVRDLASLKRLGFALRETSEIVNRPLVPRGSVARERLSGASAELENGWYRNKRVQWFRFDETALSSDAASAPGHVPTSPIYVTFNKNPDQPGGGPPSGFRLEPDGIQTHNVASSLPGDLDYSPLWMVSFYDNASFDSVHDDSSAKAAPFKARDVATVNCPVVYVKAH